LRIAIDAGADIKSTAHWRDQMPPNLIGLTGDHKIQLITVVFIIIECCFD